MTEPQSSSSVAETLRRIKPRAPFIESEPDGYGESDNDWIDANREALIELMELATVASPTPQIAGGVREVVAQALLDRFVKRGEMRLGGPTFPRGAKMADLPSSYADDFYIDADAVLAALSPQAQAGEWDKGEHEGCGVDSQRALDRFNGVAQGSRVPKVRTSHHRNKEEAARLQELVAKRYASPPAALPAGRIWDQGEHEGCGVDTQRAVDRAAEGIQWRRVNDEPYEYAIQQGPHGDEFVKLLNGSCLCRTLVIPSTDREGK